jgi:hypothetical protein
MIKLVAHVSQQNSAAMLTLYAMGSCGIIKTAVMVGLTVKVTTKAVGVRPVEKPTRHGPSF